MTQDQKELSKQNKEDSEMDSKKKIQQKIYQVDSYFDNSLKAGKTADTSRQFLES